MSNSRYKEIEQYVDVFKALSNPNRLRIFLRLVSCCAPGTVHTVEDEKACVGDIAQDLEIPPSTVSHHIKELYRAGLIRIKRRGQYVECWIDPTVLRNVADFFPQEVQGFLARLLISKYPKRISHTDGLDLLVAISGSHLRVRQTNRLVLCEEETK